MEHEHLKDFTSLVAYAKKKLTENTSAHDVNSAFLATFLCRFAMNFVIADKTTMLSNHLATLISCSDDHKMYSITYPSEPVIAEASAYYTQYDVKLCDVLAEVFNNMHANHVLAASKGDIGELACATALQYTSDYIKANEIDTYNADKDGKNFSSPISVKSFITGVCGEASAMLLKDFDSYQVNFTHFVRVESINDGVIETAYNRCAALILKECYIAADLLIVMAKKGSDGIIYAALIVQVKNYKNNITDHQANAFVNRLNPKIFELCTVFDNQPSIGLLVSAGSGKVQSKSFDASSYGTRSTMLTAREPTRLLFAVNISSDFPRLTTDVKSQLCKFSQFAKLHEQIERRCIVGTQLANAEQRT
jgi:hypothetical protein